MSHSVNTLTLGIPRISSTEPTLQTNRCGDPDVRYFHREDVPHLALQHRLFRKMTFKKLIVLPITSRICFELYSTAISFPSISKLQPETSHQVRGISLIHGTFDFIITGARIGGTVVSINVTCLSRSCSSKPGPTLARHLSPKPRYHLSKRPF